MSKITRVNQKIFGGSSGPNQIEQFGSLAGGVPNYTTDIATIQALAAWLEGWFGGVVGSNLPAIEDLNAICYVYAYQLAYIFQAGIPEWEAGTTYYTGSLVNLSGTIYKSVQDDNTNHALSDTAWWIIKGATTTLLTQDTAFVVPAGVTRIRATAIRAPQSVPRGALEHGGYTFTNGQSLALDEYGQLYMWGTNIGGQLGLGDVTPRSSPVLVLGGIKFKKADTGLLASNEVGFSIGLDLTGNIYTWGGNQMGQGGAGNSTAAVSSPVLVIGGLTFQDYAVLHSDSGAAANPSVFGLTVSGDLYAWGQNFDGQLGVGDTTPRSSPVLVLGGLKWKWVKPNINGGGGGGQYVFGLATDGHLYAWGGNNNGQLGVGDTTPRSSPVLVLGGLSFLKVVPGGKLSHSALGMTTSGALYAWGINGSGQLGVGDVASRSSPVPVLGGLVAQKISGGGTGTDCMVLTTSGQLYGWGQNSSGELGLGDTTPRSSPVLVLGGFTWLDFWMNTHVLAIRDDNTLYAWGFNVDGQLGLGDVVARSSPVIVLGGQTWISAFPDVGDYSYGVNTSGQLYMWGRNLAGCLGIGDNTSRSSPVAVLGSWQPPLQPIQSSAVLTVVPGNTYNVNFKFQELAIFGATPLGQGRFDKVLLEYLQ